MKAVDGTNTDTRSCSEVGHYCSLVSFRCTTHQDVGDSVGNIDPLSDMEHSRHWHYSSRHWRCIWFDVLHSVVGGDDDILQSLKDPFLLEM